MNAARKAHDAGLSIPVKPAIATTFSGIIPFALRRLAVGSLRNCHSTTNAETTPYTASPPTVGASQTAAATGGVRDIACARHITNGAKTRIGYETRRALLRSNCTYVEACKGKCGPTAR